MNNLKVCFALGFFMLLSSGASQAVPIDIPVKTTTTSLQVLASVGPLEFLSGAKVTIRNAKGKVLGQRKTNIRGSAIFYLSEFELSNLPFSVITSGGKIIGQTGDQFNGPSFSGHLKGEISEVSLNKNSFIYLDVLSTTAYAMRTADTSYAQATQKVREAFDIGEGFPSHGLRFKNKHTDWQLHLNAMKKNGGHDNYVRKLASRIKRGNKIKELTPSRYHVAARSKTSPRIARAAASSNSTFPQCSANLGNGSSSTSSTELIEDFGVLSMDALLVVAGVRQMIPATNAVVGMLLGGDNPNTPAETATLTQLIGVDTMLNCISSQLGYLSEQVNELELTVLVAQASSCQGDIQTDYNNYSGIVTATLPSSTGAPAPVNDQLNNQNPSLMQWVTPSNGANWLDNDGCQATINNMLFTGTTGVPSAWEQLNLNYQTENAWYTQVQVQQLQSFLSYWGTLSYQEWIVNNEYYNWNSQTTNAASLAGNISGTNTCLASTGNTMCNYQSNIANAYPGDLYSDEIGIWQSGIAVNAFPAGLAMNNFTQTSFNSSWIFGWALNQPSSCCGYPSINMGSFAVDPSYAYFNNQGIQPVMPAGAYVPSAIEQFSYPQALRTLQPTSTQIAALANPGPGGQTAQSFFFNAINYTLPLGYLCTSTANSLNCIQALPVWPIVSQWNPVDFTEASIGYATFATSDYILTTLTFTPESGPCNTQNMNQPPLCTAIFDTIVASTGNTIPELTTTVYVSGEYVNTPSWPFYTVTWTLPTEQNAVYGALLGRAFWPNSSCATTSPTSSFCQ